MLKWKTSFFIQLPVNLAGDVGVAGDSHRSHRHLPVHVQGLLQPGCPGTLQQQHQLLWLRLVQRFRPGAPPWSISLTHWADHMRCELHVGRHSHFLRLTLLMMRSTFWFLLLASVLLHKHENRVISLFYLLVRQWIGALSQKCPLRCKGFLNLIFRQIYSWLWVTPATSSSVWSCSCGSYSQHPSSFSSSESGSRTKTGWASDDPHSL